MPLDVQAMRCCNCCGRAAVLAATHAAHDYWYCNLAPAPAATIGEQRRPGAATRAAEAMDPCSIEPVGEDFPKKRICKVVSLCSGVFGRARDCQQPCVLRAFASRDHKGVNMYEKKFYFGLCIIDNFKIQDHFVMRSSCGPCTLQHPFPLPPAPALPTHAHSLSQQPERASSMLKHAKWFTKSCDRPGLTNACVTMLTTRGCKLDRLPAGSCLEPWRPSHLGA